MKAVRSSVVLAVHTPLQLLPMPGTGGRGGDTGMRETIRNGQADADDGLAECADGRHDRGEAAETPKDHAEALRAFLGIPETPVHSPRTEWAACCLGNGRLTRLSVLAPADIRLAALQSAAYTQTRDPDLQVRLSTETLAGPCRSVPAGCDRFEAYQDEEVLSVPAERIACRTRMECPQAGTVLNASREGT
jgi:hypothetical protein